MGGVNRSKGRTLENRFYRLIKDNRRLRTVNKLVFNYTCTTIYSHISTGSLIIKLLLILNEIEIYTVSV